MKLLRRSIVLLVLLGAGAVWAAYGVFDVGPDEEAIVLRLGRYNRTLGPGQFHWYLPGAETLLKERVTVTRVEEFGFRTISPGPPPKYEEKPDEKRTLTTDANLVAVEFVLQYVIDDLRAWLLDVDNPRAVIRDTANAVMRAVVAKYPIDDVLTAARLDIQDEARRVIQETVRGYGAGVSIQGVLLQDVEPPEQVKEAFADVVSAQQDRERQILDAQGYADAVVPQARGEAEKVLNEAQAYRENRILEARGEASRFGALVTEYHKAPAVTRQRLYLEMLEQVLPGMEKVIIEEDQSERVLPYLPIGKGGAIR